MTKSSPPQTESASSPKEVTPLRCLLGSSLSAALAWGLYSLTAAIAITFATKPLLSQNQIVQRIGSAVRTLVLGVASMATFIFGFVAIGLILLAIQLAVQSLASKKANP